LIETEEKPYVFLKQHNGVYIPNAVSLEQIERFLIETFTETNATIKIQNVVAVHCTTHTHTAAVTHTAAYLNTPIQEVEHKAPCPDGITNNAIKKGKNVSLIQTRL